MIHMVWIGPGLDEKAVQANAQWGEVMLHGAERLCPAWREAYDKYATLVQMKSDLVRLSALREFGGLYVDFDVTLLAPEREITEGWDTLAVPAFGNAGLLPGDVLYCPKDWPHWHLVDQYILGYRTDPAPYAAFMDGLFQSLPKGTFLPVWDTDRFPRFHMHATPHALMYRGFTPGPLRCLAGTELKRLLKTWLGIEAKPGCACNKRARLMDSHGCDWCLENVDRIVGWLREEHKRQKVMLPFSEIGARVLVMTAIRNARRTLNS
jgi:hypothetical protein